MHTKHAISVITSALVLALATGAVLAPCARATFPGRNGLITFSVWVGSSTQVFVLNPNGFGLRQISHGTANCDDPSISPDGKTIVYYAWGGASEEIRAMSTTGAHQRHLATCTGLSGWPTFSPSSRQVIFVCKGQVWLMNADGTRQRRLTHLGRHTTPMPPTYAPNGKTIVFVAWLSSPTTGKSRGEILAMDANGRHLRRLAYTDASLRWHGAAPTFGVSFSPDGKKIVYDAFTLKTKFLRVMDADGRHQRLLPGSYGFSWACYAPDGRQLLCLPCHFQIYVARVDGTRWRRLIRLSTGGVWSPPNWGPRAH
jgi:Tol biopolymer transport system component